jgi:hypothetical protein
MLILFKREKQISGSLKNDCSELIRKETKFVTRVSFHFEDATTKYIFYIQKQYEKKEEFEISRE